MGKNPRIMRNNQLEIAAYLPLSIGSLDTASSGTIQKALTWWRRLAQVVESLLRHASDR